MWKRQHTQGDGRIDWWAEGRPRTERHRGSVAAGRLHPGPEGARIHRFPQKRCEARGPAGEARGANVPTLSPPTFSCQCHQSLNLDRSWREGKEAGWPSLYRSKWKNGQWTWRPNRGYSDDRSTPEGRARKLSFTLKNIYETQLKYQITPLHSCINRKMGLKSNFLLT